MTLLNRVKTLFQRETVFCVSLVLAVLSALAVRPDAAYLSYPDYRTLALLFCLMLIVAGFRSLGVFELKARAEQLIAEVQSFLGSATSLEETLRTTLLDDISRLQSALTGYDYAQIEPLVNALTSDFERIKGGVVETPTPIG